MTAQFEGVEDPTPDEPKGESTYVVQFLRTDLTHEGNEHASPTTEIEAWVDLATVTVPARSPRKRVIREALAQSELAPQPLKVRVLDAASSAVVEVGPSEPKPEWVV